MSQVSDTEELRILRERAHRRDSDIHLDPDSLSRLRALESTRVEVEPEPVEPAIEVVPQEIPDEPAAPPEPLPGVVALRAVGRWIRGLRRSTVLIALGVLALAATWRPSSP